MMNRIKYWLFSVTYEKPILNRIANRLLDKDGRDECSEMLHKYAIEKWHVDAGLYIYGSCFHTHFTVDRSVKIGRYCSIAERVHLPSNRSHDMKLLST